MPKLITKLRIAGALVCLLALAACSPPTPNAAAETPFVPTSAPAVAATHTLPPPSATVPPESYPGGTPTTVPPLPTLDPASYPATALPTQAAAPTATPPAPATLAPVFITYRDFEIVPAQSVAKVGQEIVFLIQSASGAFHQPYAGAAAPFIFEGPPNMGHGVSWPITFSRAQTLTILCGYHGNMTATLVIEP